MARRKSITDVRNQYLRLYRNALFGGDNSRAERIRLTAHRYMDNMRSTRGYQRDLGTFNRLDAQINTELEQRNGNRFQQLMERQGRVLERMNGRTYSRSTYMGLNNG